MAAVDAVEVFDSVNCSLVFSRSALRSLEVPFNADPDGVSRLWVVEEFAHESDRADVLSVLQACVLVKEMLFGCLVFDSNSLPK